MTEDNAIRIGHAYEAPSGAERPVIATSVMFPTQAPVVTGSDGSTFANLAAITETGTLAGAIGPIFDRSLFLSQQLKHDALGNIIGWSGTYGMMPPGFRGRMPFQFTGPRFVANSCAKRLLIRVAIADVCGRDSQNNIQVGLVNMWIPDSGSRYSTIGKAAGIDGIGSPATLTVNRNLIANPLPPACGAGIDVTVTPSAADVDANLPVPGFWQ